MHRLPGNRINPAAGDGKAELLVKPNGARVVGVDMQLERRRRKLFGDRDQCRADAGSPVFRRHHELIEIASLRIDGHETDHFAAGFGYHDVRRLREYVTPALAPPVEPRSKIKLG